MRLDSFFSASLVSLGFVIGGAAAMPSDTTGKPSGTTVDPSKPDYSAPRYWIDKCIVQLLDAKTEEIVMERFSSGFGMWDSVSYLGHTYQFRLDQDCKTIWGDSRGSIHPSVKFRKVRARVNMHTRKLDPLPSNNGHVTRMDQDG
ncbi:hypothetical protein MCOR16_009701 [Pyricularia oryzae]|nr:hypothetical protein MCOR15_010584 [Pyricularia oryzae]KAI6516759.1 hypothetical protein MCOR16_009701 [Pyricularia oryzae]